jgi:hypothetical protein
MENHVHGGGGRKSDGEGVQEMRCGPPNPTPNPIRPCHRNNKFPTVKFIARCPSVQVQQQPAGGEGNFKTAMELMRSHLPSSRSRSRSRGAAAPVVLSSAANARSPRFTARSPATHREISREEERRKERAWRRRASREMDASSVGWDGSYGWVE